jgi:hypothetical protein
MSDKSDLARLLVTCSVNGVKLRVKDIERMVGNALKRLPTKNIDIDSVTVNWASPEEAGK